MSQPPPYGPPPGYGPPTVIVNQKRSGCGTAAIVILILVAVGTVVGIMVGFGACAAMFA